MDAQEDYEYYGDDMYYEDQAGGDDGEGGFAETENSALTEEIQRRVLHMDDELNKINKISKDVEKEISSAQDSVDEKSIYVGQVDYDSSPEELQAHFAACGPIERVTIMVDKFTGHAKGLEYFNSFW